MPVGALVIGSWSEAGPGGAGSRGPRALRKTIWQHDWTIAIAAGEAQRVDAPWAIPADAPTGCLVSVTLSRDGRVIDRLDHPVPDLAAQGQAAVHYRSRREVSIS